MATKKKDSSVEDRLRDRLEKVNSYYASNNEHIERARNYLQFLYVDQWDLNIRQAREALSRPTMQFNKLVPIIRSILGEQRENSPALTVRGKGKKISQDQIDLRDNLLRQTFYDSDADIVFQLASKNMLECGWGGVRVITKYEDSETFDQCLQIVPIVDFQAAFWDPTAQLPDKSDGDFAGVYTLMSKDHFKRIYPNCKNPQSAVTVGSANYLRWSTRDTILICEMYNKEYFTKKICQLSDGTIVDHDEVDEILEKQQEFLSFNSDAVAMGFKPLEIMNTRTVRDYKITHEKFVENEFLEETEWSGKILPVVYFEGDSVVIDGERIPIPYIQDAIDTQKMINYLGSEIAYAILRSRKETVMATPDQTKGFEGQWRNPDQVQGVLHYNFDNKAQKPDFITPPIFNESLSMEYRERSQDLNHILGRYEESRGEASNAESGIAIARRQQASNLPVNVYNSNWARGIKQIGKICLDLYPHIYDTEREMMIMGKDGNSKSVILNKAAGYTFNEQGMPEQKIDNDISYGKYDIEVRVDGSYDAQNAAMVDFYLKLCTINPPVFNLVADLVAKYSGAENAIQLSERLKTLVPKEILDREEGKPPTPPQPPPPNPEIIIKNKEIELQHKKLSLEEKKLMADMKMAEDDNRLGLIKSSAEMKKMRSQEKIAVINHISDMAAVKSKLVSNINKTGF